MQEIKSVFGKNVQKYRKLLKLTQEELAEKNRRFSDFFSKH